MQRYFCSNREKNCYILSKDDGYHLSKVMRMTPGEKVEIVDNSEIFLCEIESLNPVTVKVIKKIVENNENDKKIIVVQSLVNENKMDLILQKSTELGMYAFYPYTAINSVVKINDKIDKKIIRWQNIVKSACEQSKRNTIPKVNNIVNLKQLCEIKADLKILLSVNEKTKNVKKILQENTSCDTIIIVVGPEGGFTKEEEEMLMNNGFISTSLGKRVLRTETAAIAFLSMANYEWMV